MQTTIKTTKLPLTTELKDYIETKVNMLDKYLNKVVVTNCDFEVEKCVGGQHKGEIFRAEINLAVPGEILRVEKTEADAFKAVDKVKDHVVRMIKKYKEKRLTKRR